MGRFDKTLSLTRSGSSLARGLYASTPIQTAFGWRPLASLAPGDLVMTMDEGLKPIASIHTEFRPALWSVRLPDDAFGNSAAVMLPPGQSVLIRTDYALPFSGDDLALVPATALEGWRDIAPHVPASTEPILQLCLDRSAILYAGPGLLIGCEGADDNTFDIHRLLDCPSRPTLPLAAARHMVAHLVADEASGMLAGYQAAALRPPNLA